MSVSRSALMFVGNLCGWLKVFGRCDVREHLWGASARPSSKLQPGGYSPVIGQSVQRREDDPLLTGQACFVGDVALKDALTVKFARSANASGRIVAIDTEAARRAPGVVAVFTGSDVRSLGKLTVNPMLTEHQQPGFPILAVDAVHAVGQPVAAVVARTSWQAEDALDLIEIEIDDTPVQISTDCPERVAMSSSYVSGDWQSIANQAAHVVDVVVAHPRLSPSPMEGRAIVVGIDSDSEQITVHLSTQTPHRARQELCRITAVEPDRVRLIAPQVGGAFGMKASIYPEEVLVFWAADQLGRSLRWEATRGEDMLAATHGRGAQSRGWLALDTHGRFLALKADVVCPLGAWLPTSAGVPAWNAARILPGPYAIDVLDINTRAVLTNTAPVGIYRGAGRPEAAALIEGLIDQGAAVCGLDRFEIRRTNLLSSNELPHTGPTGRVLDSGDYVGALSQLEEMSAYQSLLVEQKRRRDAGELIGLGVAFYVEPSGQGWESATVSLHPDGRVVVATGSSTQGQGRETAYAQIAANELGVDISAVHVISGDTDLCPTGIGALASRSTPIGGSAVLKATQEISELRKTSQADEVIRAEVRYEAAAEAWGYGCYVAVVSIDEQTGQVRVNRLFGVDDAGRIVNPAMVAGQIRGAIAQGIGEALLEEVVYDSAGQLITGSLMDYALPRADDLPEICIAERITAAPGNLLGSKGVGEAGTIAMPAVLRSAVLDALAPLGVTNLPMPMTGERVWRAIRDAVAATEEK